jgi:hypothetical protein
MNNSDKKLMWAYGKATTLRQRFGILGMGLLGLFFPGFVVHTIMKVFKAGLNDKDVLYMLSLTEEQQANRD